MMKRLSIISIIIVFFFCSCTNNKQTTLTDEQEALIEQEVKNLFNTVVDAANNHDFETMMKYFWNNEDYVYAVNGNLMKGWDAMYNVASTIHLDPKNQKFSLNFDEIIIKVISAEAILVNGKGQILNVPVGDSTVSTNLTITNLMEKIEGNWLITAGHESTSDKVF